MTQSFNLSPVAKLILSLDLGTDTARVGKLIARGGQVLSDTLQALLTPEALRAMNQKAVMRAVQSVSFAVTGDTADFNKTTAHIVAMVMMSADQTISFESARYLCGQSNIIAPTNVGGVSRAKLQRFIGRAGTAKTISSQVSRTTGARGFLQALGVTLKSDAHSFTLQPGARESVFVLAYAHQLQSMTEGQLDLIYSEE